MTRQVASFPFPGARVTADPARVALVRLRLAYEVLLAIRPWQREERDLARQMLDLAADEVTLALSDQGVRRASNGVAARPARGLPARWPGRSAALPPTRMRTRGGAGPPADGTPTTQ